MNSSLMAENDFMNLAVSLDLLISVPLIYFLLIRKTKIPKTTVIPVLLIGIFLGSYFLSSEDQIYLTLFTTWALPFIELFIVTYIIITVRKARKHYKSLEESMDFFDAIKMACADILPSKVITLVATEIAVFYYGFFHWKKMKPKENEFTHHMKSGAPALFGALLLIIAVETIGFHFLLRQWSDIAAWVLTILSIYTGFQVFGFARSLGKRPIVIDKDGLILRYGLLNEAFIPFSDIESLQLSGKDLEKTKLTRTLSPLGEMESHNCILTVTNLKTLNGVYGFKKQFKVLGFHLDDPQKFSAQIMPHLSAVV